MTDAAPRSAGAIAAAWWHELQPRLRPDGSSIGGDRAALARLRRAGRAAEAASEPATLDLCRRLGRDWRGLDRVAIAAAVLAHVREDTPGPPVARQLGPPEAAMSWLRFRRLMQADTDDDQLISFRRAVALAGRRLNVADLARSLLAWDDRQRRRWLYAYHDAPGPDSPAAASDISKRKDDAT